MRNRSLPSPPRRTARLATAALTLLLLTSACGAPARVFKIALVAPFEGRSRQIGYDAFPAMRLAVRDEIARSTGARVAITFIAYNDDGDPARAARVARNIVLDDDTLIVIGHLALSTTLAALPVYADAGLPLIVPHLAPERLPEHALIFRMAPSAARLGNGQDAPAPERWPAAQQALARFTELSLGPPATARSVVAYDAAQLAIAAIRADIDRKGTPTRAGVAAELRAMRFNGVLGVIQFDAQNIWADAPVFPPTPAGE